MDQAKAPAAGSPARVSIEQTLPASSTAITSALSTARQTWLNNIMAALPLGCPISQSEVPAIVLTLAQLQAEGGAVSEDGSLPVLTDAQLTPIVDEAKARWIASGLTEDQAAALATVELTVADLAGATIGLTDGTSVLIGRRWRATSGSSIRRLRTMRSSTLSVVWPSGSPTPTARPSAGWIC